MYRIVGHYHYYSRTRPDSAEDSLPLTAEGHTRTGARILAEIGDGSAFANGSKLAAYAGLAQVTHQSGTSLAGETRSRRGNHRLQNAMFLAAFAPLRDPASKAFYDRKRAERKRHNNAALICLARCDVILAMIRTRQPYQPSRPAPALPEAA